MTHLLMKTDGYKLGHIWDYPNNTEFIYDNFTPRNGRIEGSKGVVVFGHQGVLQRFFMEEAAAFFALPKLEVVTEYQEFLNDYLGPNNIGTDHIAALHDLGYLPLEFKALPEGTFAPYGVPVFTITNTLPEFFWLPNYFETLLSSELWLGMTSATKARQYRIGLEKWAALTSDTPEFVDWQGHDFSYRGMSGTEAATVSGAGHLLFFTGTDTIPAISYLRKYYDGSGLIGGSVAATEHSVMCANGEENELETFLHLLSVHAAGILSVVSDTWNLWRVLTVIARLLKQDIIARDGKLVFRPDSGDPVKILCGDETSDDENVRRGVVEILWDEFGGTVNSFGYGVLDPHVGVIYGDSITTERQEEICRQLDWKGFASTNVVLGIGSYTYQYVTRDTHGFAMKATAARIDDEWKVMFKKPITDDGGKFSARGFIAVQEIDGKLTLIDDLSHEEYLETPSLLETIWKDGKFVKRTNLAEIRQRVRAGLFN